MICQGGGDGWMRPSYPDDSICKKVVQGTLSMCSPGAKKCIDKGSALVCLKDGEWKQIICQKGRECRDGLCHFPSSPNCYLNVIQEELVFTMTSTKTLLLVNSGDKPCTIKSVKFSSNPGEAYTVQVATPLDKPVLSNGRFYLDIKYTQKGTRSPKAILDIQSTDPQKPKIEISLKAMK